MNNMSETGPQPNPQEHPLPRVYVPEGYHRVREKEGGLDYFEKHADPSGIIFVREGEPRHLIRNAEERGMYQENLASMVLNGLSVGTKADSDARAIYQEIHSKKTNERFRGGEGVSLFAEVDGKLNSLRENPGNFAINEVTFNEDTNKNEIKELRKIDASEVSGELKRLAIVRGKIVEAADCAGLFEELDKEISRVLKETKDYEAAISAVEQLASDPRFLRTETTELNRASPDFAGISSAYLGGKALEMKYHLLKSQEEQLGQQLKAVEQAGGPQEIIAAIQQQIDTIKVNLNNFSDKFVQSGDPKEKERPFWWKIDPKLSVPQQVAKGMPQPSAAASLPDDATKYLKRFAESQEALFQLQKGGYDQLMEWVIRRTAVNPETFAQNLPLWYRELGKENGKVDYEKAKKYKDAIEALLSLNYIAYVKQRTGGTESKSWNEVPVRVERQALNTLVQEMPGFRMALATMTEELFDNSQDHFVFKDKNIVVGGMEVGVYEIMENKEANIKEGKVSLEWYKADVAKRLVVQLKADPSAALEWSKAYGLLGEGKTALSEADYEKLALFGVSAVDNYFFATGVYDSADEFRKEEFEGFPDLDSSSISSDDIRASMAPDKKLMNKIMKGQSWGGPLGEWIRLNYEREVRDAGLNPLLSANENKADRDRVRTIAREWIKYMPKRLFFDMSHHTGMNVLNNDGTITKTNLDQYIIGKGENKHKVEVTLADGTKQYVYDFKKLDKHGKEIKDGEGNLVTGAGAVNFNYISSDEVWQGYGIPKAAAYALSEHMTGGDARGKLSAEALMTNIAKLRNIPGLKEQMRDPNFLKVAVGLVISPEGFMDTPDLLLKIDKASYMTKVNNEIEKVSRILQWYAEDPKNKDTASGLRTQMLKAFHSGDYNKFWNVFADFFLSDSFLNWLGERYRLEQKAKKAKIKQIAELEYVARRRTT